MNLYKIKNKKLLYIEEVGFKTEYEIQRLCEENIKELFDLELVCSQFIIQKFRIDTLAFDEKIKSFVIIEYKKDENFSVVDQGYTYLSLVLNNKAECILVYNEKKGKQLKKQDVDWSQTKVIFVAPSFTSYQIQSINFKDLPIELWEIKKYENNLVVLKQIEVTPAKESIKIISKKSKIAERVNKEIKVYTEEEHLARAPKGIKELYGKFKTAVLSLGSEIKIKPTKWYIAFVSKTNFTDVEIRRKKLKIYLNLRKGELEDPRNIARDVSTIGHWGNGDYQIYFNNEQDLDYIMSLVKQSYNKNS